VLEIGEKASLLPVATPLWSFLLPDIRYTSEYLPFIRICSSEILNSLYLTCIPCVAQTKEFMHETLHKIAQTFIWIYAMAYWNNDMGMV